MAANSSRWKRPFEELVIFDWDGGERQSLEAIGELRGATCGLPVLFEASRRFVVKCNYLLSIIG